MFKIIIQFILKILAKLILAKYKPDIIGITGSVGKTGVKEAIYAVLSRSFRVRRSLKNYNNEIGLPLAVIDAPAQGKFVLGWLAVIVRALTEIIFRNKNYPEILILEMGIDKPGDMKYLLSVAAPRVGVITRIGRSHLEFFKNSNEIRKEKELLVKSLLAGGWAVLNFDDEETKKTASQLKAKVISYGLNEGALVRATNITALTEFKAGEKFKAGINFKLIHNGSAVPVFLPAVSGAPAVEAALAAACLGIIYGLNLVEISEALKNFRPPAGRMNLLDGIKNTLIIDDSYNASPQSAFAALEVVKKFSLEHRAKKIAALGDMLELGSYSEEGHREVGKKAAQAGVDLLVTVGERSRDIGRGAVEEGMPESAVFNFSRVEEAGLFVQEKMKEGDLILVKGSQGMRMEKIVKEIMAEPLRAEELLVRQGEEWFRKH